MTALLVVGLLMLAACGGSSSVSDVSDSTEVGPDDGLSDQPIEGAGAAAGVVDVTEITLGTAAPDIGFTYFDGRTGTLDDFSGKPLVINFFASWCAPCAAELPDFQAAYELHGDDVGFLGFNVTDEQANAEALLNDTGVTFPAANDPDQSIHFAFDGIAMPTTVFVYADGSIADTRFGAVLPDDLEAAIQELL